MSKFEYGLKRGFGMVVGAIAFAMLWSGMVTLDIVSLTVFRFFNVISILGLVFLVDKSRYWGFGYLFGWVIGIIIGLDVAVERGFLGAFDIFLYGGTAVSAICLRIYIHNIR